MSCLVAFPQHFSAPAGASPGARDHAQWACEQLERGHVLFFPQTPFPLPSSEQAFLLTLQQTGAGFHKNIAYRPETGRITGLRGSGGEAEGKLQTILQNYSDRAAQFVCDLLLPYAADLRRDFASFRPLEERGRPLRLHARNDLLHIDAFPTRPTNGDRILRLFTNLNLTQSRVWLTSHTFPALARRWAMTAGLDEYARRMRNAPARRLRRAAQGLGLPVVDRSPYDQFMLRFHDFLKENAEFQSTCPKNRMEFPPASTWMVFTDMVSHAVLSGRFALEQTFFVSHRAMVKLESAPHRVLEQICGRAVIDA